MSLPAFPDSVPLTAFRLPRNSKRYRYSACAIVLSHCHFNIWESYLWYTVLAFIGCVFTNTLPILRSSFCFAVSYFFTRCGFGSISGCGWGHCIDWSPFFGCCFPKLLFNGVTLGSFLPCVFPLSSEWLNCLEVFCDLHLFQHVNQQ